MRDKSATRRSSKKKKTADGEEKTTYYCYSEEERVAAIQRLGNNAEITRFKGAGEINADEFAEFIGRTSASTLWR